MESGKWKGKQKRKKQKKWTIVFSGALAHVLVHGAAVRFQPIQQQGRENG